MASTAICKSRAVSSWLPAVDVARNGYSCDRHPRVSVGSGGNAPKSICWAWRSCSGSSSWHEASLYGTQCAYFRRTPPAILTYACIQGLRFALSYPIQAAASGAGSTAVETRSIRVPPQRYTPLKESWEAIVKPIVEHAKLQVRMNTRSRAVEIRSTPYTTDIGALQVRGNCMSGRGHAS